MNNNICLYTKPFPWLSSYYQLVDLAVECGLSSVEGFNDLEFSVPDTEEAVKLRAYADSKGVSFPCFSVYIDVTGVNAEEEIRKLKGYAKVAAILGSPYLHHTIVPQHQSPAGITENAETLYQKGIAAVREIYDYAKTLGVRTVYEDQGYIFNGVEGFKRFLREVERDVGVVIDLGNIFQVDETPEPFIEAFLDRIAHVHIKDVRYTCDSDATQGMLGTLHGGGFTVERPGEGIIDIGKCVSMIKKSGYTGFYAAEFSAGPGGEKAMAEYIRMIRCWINS